MYQVVLTMPDGKTQVASQWKPSYEEAAALHKELVEKAAPGSRLEIRESSGGWVGPVVVTTVERG